MKNKKITRRDFVKTTGTVVLGSGVMVGCGGGSVKNKPIAAPEPDKPTDPVTPPQEPDNNNPATPGDQISINAADKALVFIMLDGGNDSFNMLVPTSTAAYNEYKASRGGLSLTKESLLALNGFTDKNQKTFGLHQNLPKVQALFNQKKLAFVANVAPMIERVTKAEFKASSKPLPVGLMSHSDQFKHWQTSNPGERINRGWFGDFADVLQKNKASSDISMNISLAGSNIMQNGKEATEYAITDKGSIGLAVKDPSITGPQADLNRELLNGFNKILESQPSSAFQESYIGATRNSQAQHEKFLAATKDITINTRFADTDLSRQLKMVAKSIKAAPQLGMRQQTFFIRYIGWDHHDELLKKHGSMLKILDDALGSFQQALDELGVADKVVTFTGSDFGRTLTSNGNGTDHAWGGNTLVMGNDVDGGKVFGEYPALSLGDANPLDAGDGVLIPTTATDELYAELALWFGVQKGDLGKLFPNLKNFYAFDTETDNPLGLIKT